MVFPSIARTLHMQRGFLTTARLLCRVSPSKCVVPVRKAFPFLLQQPRHFGTTKFINMSYSTIERGAPNTLGYRVFFSGPNGLVSPFHDIPLYADAEKKTFNMIVEVPRWTNAKMEIDTSAKLNPIKQDIKKGKLRFVNNCFPHHGYIWNYGALPQTWEDPNHVDEHTHQKGDNDPLDVCEIGFKVHKQGAVIQVKVLGVLAMIDEGETDWKVLVIDVTDPLADQLNDVEDIEKHMPGFVSATHEWFRIYKIPTGKPENQFAFNGEAKNKEFALGVIQQTHEQWQKLMQNSTETGGLGCENTSVVGSPYQITQEDAKAILEQAEPVGEAAPIAPEVDMWHYVKL